MGDYTNIDDIESDYALDNVLIVLICAGVGTLFIVIICFVCYHFWRPLKAWKVSDRNNSGENCDSTQHTSIHIRNSALCKPITRIYTILA